MVSFLRDFYESSIYCQCFLNKAEFGERKLRGCNSKIVSCYVYYMLILWGYIVISTFFLWIRGGNELSDLNWSRRMYNRFQNYTDYKHSKENYWGGGRRLGKSKTAH